MKKLPLLEIDKSLNNNFKYIEYKETEVYHLKNHLTESIWRDNKYNCYYSNPSGVTQTLYNGQNGKYYKFFHDHWSKNQSLYLVYTTDYDIYSYDRGNRVDRSYSLSSEITYTDRYTVEVPPAEEQFETFLKKHPEAKYFFPYMTKDIPSVCTNNNVNYEYAIQSSLWVYGEIKEAILLLRYYPDKKILRCIDSERFDANWTPYGSYEWVENLSARNPVISYDTYWNRRLSKS